MALDAALENLRQRLKAMNDALTLVRKAVDDRPEGHQLERELDGAVLELMSTMHEAHSVVQRGDDSDRQADLERELRALTSCHQHCLDLSDQLSSLSTYERLAVIVRFGNQRSREWPGWADTVVAQINGCQQAWSPLNRALLACWQELSERLATRSGSVYTTNIGQKIHVSETRNAQEPNAST